MKALKLIIVAFGSLGIGATVASGAYAQDIDVASLQFEAEEACRVALQKSTIEALEEYLNKYPQASTACRALATEALHQFSPSNDGEQSSRRAGGTRGTGYAG